MTIVSEVAKCLQTIREMLEDRGVTNMDSLNNITPVEIQGIINKKNTFCIDMDKDIRIIIDLSSKFKIAEVKKLIDPENMFGLYIIVAKEKINTQDIKKFNDFKVEYQLFDLKELQFNISKHYLVPKHELITDENIISELVKAYQAKNKLQFPYILKNDPMAKYLYAKSGNLVKITRCSPTSGEYVMYRTVV